MKKTLYTLIIGALFMATGCSSPPPITSMDYVDIDRFMGKWYVIANIPTFIEKDAYNPTETYKLNDNGTIATTFQFNKGSFSGPLKTYHPTGFITDSTSNAIWGMRFIWPFKADFRILHVDDNYQYTIIGRIKRDYVWIMARSPQISEEEYNKLLTIVENAGYNMEDIVKAPQQSLEERRAE